MTNENEKALRLPLLLKGKAQTRIWGGKRLGSEYGVPYGEIWSLSVREKNEENCTVSGGAFDGMTLKALIEQTGGKIVGGSYRAGDRFPLLIKLIDTGSDLSLQVHPTKDYAELRGHDGAKTEMWYVLSHEDGARFLYGMKDGETAETLAEALHGGACASLMREREAKLYDVLFVPAGMPHAIGGGIFLAEIQENSDTTYRLDDYGRRDAKGNLRELHVEDGLAVSRPFTEEEVEALRYAAAANAPDAGCIADTSLFRVSRVENECLAIGDCFRALIALTEAQLTAEDGFALSLSPYDTCFLPAHAGKLTLTGAALFVSVPALEKEETHVAID